MQSKAVDVDHYLQDVPEERRAVLTELRNLCIKTLSGYEESMAYGMPSYTKDGVVEVAFASQKRYISFYILKQEVLDQYREDLQGLNIGKGCIRYSKPQQLDFTIAKKLLAGTVASSAEIC